MKRMFFLRLISFLAIILMPIAFWAQEGDPIEAPVDSLSILESVSLDPIQFAAKPPFTAKSVSGEELKERNLGQDLPMLLKNTPSIVATSDAGAGVGYTGLRIRGSDQTRINVTINGIPLNDSESHNVFWVNTPDLASSTDRIVVQRGVGTSTNGTAAFGASVNIETSEPPNKAGLEAAVSIGSFSTNKYTFQAATGEIAKNIFAQGRISHINSDGYVDRASSDLFSYNAEIMYKNRKRKLWFTTFGGREETYQSWFGVDAQTLNQKRTFNPAGAILDEEGQIQGFYPNQVDDYHQDHYQLHYEEKLNQWKLNAALHYTYGRGYFEEYQNNQNLEDYGLEGTNSDLVRRQWLRNHFYGLTFGLSRKFDDLDWIVGGAINRYDGDHFGRVIWVEEQPGFTESEYYFNNGLKDEISIYSKAVFKKSRWEFFADIQFRHIGYNTSAPESGLSALEDFKILDEQFFFFNPKAGLTLSSGFGDFYLSYALGHREPNRSDFLDTNQIPEAESLHDWELGFRSKTTNQKWSLNANLFYMLYRNQLVLTGEVNDVGAFVRVNSGESFRTGLELDANYQLNRKISVFGNAALSLNRNQNWSEEINGELVDFGNTPIAFSPGLIANIGLDLALTRALKLNWISKYVGEQFMSNAGFDQSILEAYTISDLGLRWQLNKVGGIELLEFNLLINNIFNEQYENNGYYFNFFDGNSSDPRGLNHNPFYYPQAGTNFLVGVRVKL